MKTLLFSAQLLLLVLLWDVCEGQSPDADDGNYKYCKPKNETRLRKKREAGNEPVEIIPYTSETETKTQTAEEPVLVARTSEEGEEEKATENKSDKKAGKGRKKRDAQQRAECTEEKDCRKHCSCRDDGTGKKFCMRQG